MTNTIDLNNTIPLTVKQIKKVLDCHGISYTIKDNVITAIESFTYREDNGVVILAEELVNVTNYTEFKIAVWLGY